MVPPAGTSTMLRSRRRDATLKPNRTLDRNASRGMLYENEELRLRTININAEVEKGQNYIKKLRRENEQLKREIWNLREEYERLENYVKSREQSENEEEDGDGDDDDGRPTMLDEEPTASADVVMAAETATVTLETVVEEDDEHGEQTRQDVQQNGRRHFSESIDDDDGCGKSGEPSLRQSDSVAAPDSVDVNDCDNNNNCDAVADAVDWRRDIVVDRIGPAATASHVTSVTMTADGGCDGDTHCDNSLFQQHCRRDPVVADRSGNGRPSHEQDPPPHEQDPPPQEQDPPTRERPHVDVAILQPHTACFDVGNNCQLQDLTVDEVIDAVRDAELKDKLRTVCLTDERCYMTFADAECLERMLHAVAFKIRDVSLLLMDTGAGAVILSLTGVPDAVTDKDVLKCLKKYGTIIGGVERKTARGGATGGERYVRVRPTLGAPRYLWFGSDKVIVRQLTEHETGTMNSIARRKSFRSHIKLNLKMASDPSAAVTSSSSSSSSSKSSAGYCCDNGESCKENTPRGSAAVVGRTVISGGGGGYESAAVNGTVGPASATSVQNGFRFPSDAKTATGAQATESKTAAMNPKSSGSPKRSKATANDRDGGPPPNTATTAESPLRARRRPSLMGFRRETIKHRAGSVSRADGGGEDANSDTSTICRRKLSVTGREGTGKVPWCGCWGNGCL